MLLPPDAVEQASSKSSSYSEVPKSDDVEQVSSQSSSYSEVPKSVAEPLTSEQEQTALDHHVVIPSVGMLPPPAH